MSGTATAARRRILHVVDSLGVGGLERSLVQLVERTRDELDHDVWCLRAGGSLREPLEALGAGVRVIGRSAAGIPSLIRRLRRDRPAVLHARNWGTVDAVFAARLAGVPAVLYAEHGPHAWSGWRRNWGRRAIAAAADVVVAVSGAVRDHLREHAGIRDERITLISNGVDADHFRPRGDRAALRRARGLPADALIIGGVGRLHSVKRFEVLVAAFEALAARHPNSFLVLVGDGPERGRLEEEIRARGMVARARLTGVRDDVAEWLATMDVFAHSSAAEGLSTAILQAMAAGLPVVAANLAENREVVADGATGRLVAGGAAADFAAALDSYCGDPAARRAHGAAGRRRAQAEFPLSQMVERYRVLYRQLGARA